MSKRGSIERQSKRRPGSASATSNSTSHLNGPRTQTLSPARPHLRSVAGQQVSVGNGHPFFVAEDVRRVRPDFFCRTRDLGLCLVPRHASASFCIHDRQRDCQQPGQAREGRLSLGTDALHHERIGLAFALVRPAHRHVRAALDGLQVGGRPDRTKRRNGDPPADVVVRLPVDDLFEGREAAGDALGLRADAAPSARRAPRRSRAGPPTAFAAPARSGGPTRPRARPARSRRDRRRRSAIDDIQAARRRSTSQRASRSSVNVVTRAEVLDRLRRLGEAKGVGVETERVDGRRREQREAVRPRGCRPSCP